MQIIIRIQNILIGLFFVINFYNLSVDAFGGEASKMAVILAMILMINSIILILINIKKVRITNLSLLVFIWLLYVLLNVIFTFSTSSMSFMFLLRSSCLWGFMYFYGVILGALYDSKNIKSVFVTILPILISMLLIVSTYRTLDSAGMSGRGVQASIGYVFFILILLPWYLLIKNNMLKTILVFAVVAVSLYSMKRSASIIALTSLLLYIYYNYIKNNNSNLIFKIFILIIIPVLSFNMILYINNASDNNLLHRFENISEDGGSGRDIIYEDVINSFVKLPIESKLMGSGYNGVVENQVSNGLSAHNDFLEVLYDYGILGFAIYILIWGQLFKRFFLLKRKRSIYFVSYAISILIFTITSLVSHLIIYPTYFISLSLYWGYIEGSSTRNNNFMKGRFCENNLL